MKSTYLIAAFLMLSATAFSQESKSRLSMNVGVGTGYHLTFNNSAIQSYHSIGGKFRFLFHDTWYVGYDQSTSISPGQVLKDDILGYNKSSISDYSIIAGRKWTVGSRFYVLGGVNAGINYFELSSPTALRDDVAASSKDGISFLAGAHTAVGINISKFLAVEAGAHYRAYFKHDDLLVRPKDFSPLGFNVSLVGNFDLIK